MRFWLQKEAMGHHGINQSLDVIRKHVVSVLDTARACAVRYKPKLERELGPIYT